MVALLKKIPLGLVEMTAIRDRAEQLRDGNFCDYRPVLPLMLASFIFDVLCTPGEDILLSLTYNDKASGFPFIYLRMFV